MAMLITRFHKLIQSKVIWYIVLGIIVISFVGFFTPTMTSSARPQKVRPAGELFGKKVSMDEYSRAKNNAYCWRILSSGQMLSMTDELNDALRQEAWRRLAVLRKAQEQKISATGKEVVDQIQKLPLFLGKNGAFDLTIYRSVLQALGLTDQQFEELFREQIVMGKLMSASVQAALVSPSELETMYRRYTDRFVLDYILIPYSDVEKEVTVSAEEAQAVYAENSEKFRMEAKVQVFYVEFPVSDFLAQAEVPEDAALKFYNANIEQYRVETTNENAVTEYKPFEQVEDEIKELVRMDAARRLAADKATEFVVEVAPKAEGYQPDFNGVAAAFGLQVKTLPAFGMSDTLKSIDATAPFRAAAFGLENDSYTSFSDAVVGKDFVYVLSLDKRFPSFIPDFAAVEDKVMKEARRQATLRLLAERAKEIEETVTKAGETEVGFKEAVAPFGLPVQTTQEFDVSTEMTDPNANALLRACVDVEQGKLCELTPVKDGVLLASVASRTPAEAGLESAELRQELTDWLSRSNAQRLAAEWQESLLVEGNFKNLMTE